MRFATLSLLLAISLGYSSAMEELYLQACGVPGK
jgi:hypothetical protein